MTFDNTDIYLKNKKDIYNKAGAALVGESSSDSKEVNKTEINRKKIKIKNVKPTTSSSKEMKVSNHRHRGHKAIKMNGDKPSSDFHIRYNKQKSSLVHQHYVFAPLKNKKCS